MSDLLGVRSVNSRPPLFKEYLRNGNAQRCFSVCKILRDSSGEWDKELLVPLLSDRRPSNGYTHAVKPNANEPRLPIRVCDAAAETICAHRKDLTFEIVGLGEDLDQQIHRIQQQLNETAPSRK